MQHTPLRPEQAEALGRYALEHGDTWKAMLRHEWRTGTAGRLLHRLRSSHGPDWLEGYTPPRVYSRLRD